MTADPPAPNRPEAGDKGPAAPGYGAALLEAVRKSPRPYGAYGQAGRRPMDTRAPSAIPTPAAVPPATRPTPMPKRPKGRFLVGLFLLAICATIVFLGWDATVRYSAYGLVAGRTVDVAPPWPGVVTSLYVRAGDDVRQGDLIAAVSSLELDHRVQRLADELVLAQADLEAEVARLRLRSELNSDQALEAESDYLARWSELIREQATLADLAADWKRLERLQLRSAVSEEERDNTFYAWQGQQGKVQKLTEAVETLKQRYEQLRGAGRPSAVELQPLLAKIRTLQADLVRSRDLLRQGELRAAAHGRVLAVLRHPGEHADATEPIVRLLVEGTLQPVLYVSQDQADSFAPGKMLPVKIAGHSGFAGCEVERLGEQMEHPPRSLERYYYQHALLLPVYLRVLPGGEPIVLRVGSEVRLPRLRSAPDLPLIRSREQTP